MDEIDMSTPEVQQAMELLNIWQKLSRDSAVVQTDPGYEYLGWKDVPVMAVCRVIVASAKESLPAEALAESPEMLAYVGFQMGLRAAEEAIRHA